MNKITFIFIHLSITFGQNSNGEESTPILKKEFYIKNDFNDMDVLKWVSIYSYEDNVTLLQINERYIKFNEQIGEYRYHKTHNNIFFDPKDFRDILFNIMNDTYQSFQLNREEHVFHVFISKKPYYITVLQKTGTQYEEKWRGLIFDWKEVESILRNASFIMNDLNI